MNVSSKKKDDRAATLKGAAVGAAIGVGLGAAAAVLSDKKNRKKLLNKTEALKNEAEKSLQSGKKGIQSLRKTLKKNIDASLPDTKKLEVKTSKPASKAKTVKKTIKGK